MKPSSIVTKDGIRLVYDVVGTGPALLLLHGGGGDQSRQSWHDVGYVQRLQADFTVITMDIRGHGDSDKPIDPAAYSIDRMCQDILDVANAGGVDRFILWGFSYGGNIGRYLAAASERVTKMIVVGIPFGLAADGDFRQFIEEFGAHWQPILHASQFDPITLSAEDKEVWEMIDVPVFLAWLTAMLDWRRNEPADLQCPTLWLSGSKNEGTVKSMHAYAATLPNTAVQTHIFPDLDHPQEFEQIDTVLPVVLNFIRMKDEG